VEELRRVYDGNPNLAFIDISGYGNFSEWSWQDRQTEWDTAWEDNYANGTPSPDSFETLDGQARRRLVDMFIGGSFQGHSCRAKDGTVVQVNYSYPGFHSTQLVMPYAGIVQSTQYAFSSRRDVGFRYDCLGRDGQKVYEKVGDEISQLWKSAPVVFELCKPDEVDLEDAKWLLQTSHGSIVHNNNWTYSYEELEDMMRYAGYRFFLEKANMHINHRTIDLEMSWQNTGYSPPYAKMGQVFILRFYLLDITGATVLDRRIRANISKWYPSESLDMNDPPDNRITTIIQLPISIQPGTYYAGLSIIDRRTGKPINLAFSGRDKNGVNILFPVTIK
jgi:hypothetical protein